ncbi:MAG TPA: transglutaminase domain-containing protein, partial [Lachnospiraceae bacterium]|nr:transglutaminase domain-containing protein [Lachnospiraceae bacterium]
MLRSKKHKKKWSITQYLLLTGIIAILSCLQYFTVQAQKTHTKEESVYVDEYKSEKELDEILLDGIADDQIDKSDISIIDKKVISTEYEIQYSYSFYDSVLESENVESDFKYVTVENDSKLSEEEINQYFLNKITAIDSSYTDISIISVEPVKKTYVVTYGLYTESDEYKKSVADFFGAPATKKDSKAVLSKVSLYIQGYRIPYMLEDAGEFYIPNDTQLDFVDARIDDLLESNPKEPFYNIKWTSFVKAGTVIGKITKNTDEEGYRINNINYVKMSDLIPEWRKTLTYSKKDKCFIYGVKPSAKEKSLKEDVFYNFAKKATVGCNTTNEKIKALHDAIVLRCTYDTKNMAYYNKLINSYDMTTSQGMSLHMLNDKTGICENYARLFKECCDRLFIPCDLVLGSAGEAHMWNRVYIGSKQYHIDVTFADYLNNTYKQSSDIRRSYYLKSANEFMGSHSWSGPDYKPYKFSTKWKSINRNNIKTTEQLRKATVYASYLCRKGQKKTFKFRITGSNVDTRCGEYVISNGYV